MSAMTELIATAEELGIAKLTWHCDVTGWSSEPRRGGRWTCHASGPSVPPHQGVGRTGEEALRDVVLFLQGLE